MGDLNISRQMASALGSQTSKDLVNKILEDGKVDGADKENIAKLKAELASAATKDDGKVDEDEETLIDAIDNSGLFGTSNQVVEKNLKSLQQTYQQSNGDVSFAGLKLTSEGGWFSSNSERVLKLRDQEFSGTGQLDQAIGHAEGQNATQNTSQQTSVQDPAHTDADQSAEVHTPVTPTPAPPAAAPKATSVQELETANKPRVEALNTTLTEIKSTLADNPKVLDQLKKNYLSSQQIPDPAKADKAKLLSAMGTTAEEFATKNGLDAAAPEFEAKVREAFTAHVDAKAKEELGSFVQAIEKYQSNPSHETLTALHDHKMMAAWGTNSQALMSSDSAQNQALIQLRAQVNTAYEIGQSAQSVQSSVDAKTFKTPASLEDLNKNLEADKAKLYDKAGGLNVALAESKQVLADLTALKKSNPKLYEQQFGYLGPDYLKKLETNVSKLQTYVDKFNKEAVMTEPGPELLADLDSLRSHIVGLRKGYDTMPVTDKTKIIKDRFNKAAGDIGYSGTESAINTVRDGIRSKTQILAELETAKTTLEGLLTKPQSPDVLKLVQAQLDAIKTAEQQIKTTGNVDLNPEQAKAFGQVLKAIDSSKSVSGLSSSTLLPNYMSFSGIGGLDYGMSSMGYGAGGMSTMGSGTGGTSATGLGDFQLTLGGANPGSFTPGLASDFMLPGSLTLDAGYDPNSYLDPTYASLSMADPMMGYCSAYSPPLFDFSSYKFDPPSLEQSLLQQAQSAEQTDIKIAINEKGSSEQLKQFATAEKMLEDSKIDAGTQSHLRDVLSATKLTLNGRGDELINGVKASELAKDLDLLTKIYNHVDEKRGKELDVNAARVNEAVTLLKALPADANRGAKGGEVMTTILGKKNREFYAKMDQTQQAAVEDLSKKTDEANAAKAALLDKTKNSPVLARILELEAAKKGGDATTADKAVQDIAALLSDPAKAQQELQRMLSDPEVGGKLTPEERQQLGALYTEFSQVSARVNDINSRFTDHLDEQIQRIEELKESRLKDMPAGPEREALAGFYDLALNDLKSLKAKVASGGPIEQADIVKFQAGSFVRQATGALMDKRKPGGVALAADLYRQLSTGKINLNTARTTLRNGGLTQPEVTRVEQNATQEASVIAAFGNEFNAANNGTSQFAATHADANTPPADETGGGNGGQTGGGSAPGTAGNPPVGGGTSKPPFTPASTSLTAISTAGDPDAELNFSGADGATEMMEEAGNVATALTEVSQLDPAKIEAFMAKASEVLNGDVQGVMNTMLETMKQSTQELSVENQNLERINAQHQEILKNLIDDGSYLSPEAKAAIDAANKLGDELILSPMPKVNGEQHLSDLINDFIKIIRDLDAKTRQLVLAQLARQMMTNAITAFYKDKLDKNNKYHEQQLQRMSENMKAQISHALQQSMSGKATSSQAAAAISGDTKGVGEVMNQTSVRARFDEMLKVTNQMKPPLPAGMQTRILAATEGIFAAGGTATSEDDRHQTLRMRSTLLGVSPN